MRVPFDNRESSKKRRLKYGCAYLADAAAHALDRLVAKDAAIHKQNLFRADIAQVFIEREHFAGRDHQSVKTRRRDLNIRPA